MFNIVLMDLAICKTVNNNNKNHNSERQNLRVEIKTNGYSGGYIFIASIFFPRTFKSLISYVKTC